MFAVTIKTATTSYSSIHLHTLKDAKVLTHTLNYKFRKAGVKASVSIKRAN